MLTELISNLRHVRGPLSVGYGLLAAFWLTFGDRLPRSNDLDPDSVVGLTNRALSSFGTSSRLATLAFVAVVVGSAVFRVLGLRQRIESIPLRLPLEEDVAELGRALNREVYPSETERDVILLKKDLQRELNEFDFRCELTIATLIPSVVLISHGRFWILTLLVPILFALDAYGIGAKNRKRNDQARLHSEESQRLAAKRSLLELRHTAPYSVDKLVADLRGLGDRLGSDGPTNRGVFVLTHLGSWLDRTIHGDGHIDAGFMNTDMEELTLQLSGLRETLLTFSGAMAAANETTDIDDAVKIIEDVIPASIGPAQTWSL